MSMHDIRVGFTGTREGMSQAQKDTLYTRLFELRNSVGIESFHHGDCTGSDEEAADIAQELGIDTVAHPPLAVKFRAYHRSTIIRTPKPFMVRNHDIVLECRYVFAAPRTDEEEVRSGTWATYRFAKACGTDVEVLKR